jgi:putative flavoprotein involved in K+ transport
MTAVIKAGVDGAASTVVEQVETAVIGAGQAGLSVGYHLTRRGRTCVILDANERVGDNWRRHYKSLRLYSPASRDGLPGMAYPADSWHFPTRDEFADYLEEYARRFALPVRGGTRIKRVARNGGRWVLDCAGRPIEAENVVVATGTFGRPYIPEFAPDLDPGIFQLHSSEYKRPSQLRDGPVLVVGAAHSGADVAIEVADQHETILCGRDTGQVPFDIEGRGARLVGWRVVPFLAHHVFTLRTPIGRHLRPKIRAHGGPLLRFRRNHLAAAGVERVPERATGVRDGKPVLGDDRVVDVANVIWCTGFKHDFGWIDRLTTGADGYPEEKRGVVPSAPGLFFVGLAFQYAFSSMLILGAGRDAEHVVKRLVARDAEALTGVETA